MNRDLRVVCHAGHRGEEEPRRLVLDGREIMVAEIVERWLTPNHRCFKVEGDGATYVLRHGVVDGRWELAAFARGLGPSRSR